ncbi:uncharacterized protein [Anabrus simplex]|uniref:uncharacterized protein n=1 Tax=Anabrus simplex TaxID=316456 RepID=UPI0035A3666D
MAACLCSRKIVLSRNSFLKLPKRNGYIVLLPEVTRGQSPSDIESFKTDGLPEINGLTTEKCIGLIGKHTLELQSGVYKLEDDLKVAENPPQDLFEKVLNPLEELSAPLDATWGLMKTLYLTNSSLMPANCYMTIHDQARRVRAKKYCSKPIYTACKAWDRSSAKEDQRRVVDKFLLEGRLNGLDLEPQESLHLNNILNKLSQERGTFRSKVEVATKKFKHVITDSNIVREFPEDLLKSMAYDSTQYQRGPWTVTLQPYISSRFMEHCPDPELRWNVWQAGVRRCSGYSDKALETSSHLEAIRVYRREQAKHLGYSSFADMSMQTKMAGSLENVRGMLDRLHDKALPVQKQEVESLEQFALSRKFDGPLQLWDVPYWRRKQQKALYNYDEEQLREYFPFPKVLDTLFDLCSAVFGIRFVHQPGVESWHEDVKFFHILDDSSSEPVGGFYLDPYIREGEKILSPEDVGWMVALRNRSDVVNNTPIASLVFNFQPPLYGKPSLLSFTQVKLLFQKFGHALQHLLTEASYTEVSGLSNIEWDAVEICSNVMAHWLYDRSLLKKLSSHYESEVSLPDEVLDKIIHVRQHMAAYDLCQELYLATLDLELHSSNEFWLDVVRRLWPRFYEFPLDKRDSQPCSFTAIFSEEWGAAYYCHLWARLVAADVFSAFQEVGAEDVEKLSVVGKRFRSTFLALGGGCHPSEVFRRFRGRDPSPHALLRSLGLKQLKSGTAQ